MEEPMAAYLIVSAIIADREAFMRSGYPAAAAELVSRFGGRYVIRAPGAELLEGEFGSGASVVISEWTDARSARRFWDSPEYANVKQRREGLAECQVLLIESLTGSS
jgi:uncharacterized protein (DUF1330 family)